MPRAACGAVELRGPGDLAVDDLGGRVDVERHAAAQQLGRQVAQHDMRIGDRRALAAAAVGRRTGIGAGALRADGQGAGIDLGDRAAARADRHHVDHRQGQRPFADVALLGERDAAVLDQADVGAGAADIDGDDVLDAARRGDVARADHAGGRARQGRQGRRAADGGGAGDAAVRLHQQQRRDDMLVEQALLQARDVGRDAGHHHGVEHRGQRALVLAHHRQHVGRGGDRDAGQLGPQDVGDLALVRRVGEGMQQADRDRLDAELAALARRRLRRSPRRAARSPRRRRRCAPSPRARDWPARAAPASPRRGSWRGAGCPGGRWSARGGSRPW